MARIRPIKLFGANANLTRPYRAFVGMAVAASLCFCFVPAALPEESVPAPNLLIVEASQLIRAAEDARAPEDKIALLEDARDRLQSVIDNHPASDLALKLATGQPIGSISLAAVDQLLETALEGCWDSPTVECVSRLVLAHAESSGDCRIQGEAYLALAIASFALEEFEKADSAMKQAEELDGSCRASYDDILFGPQSAAQALPSIVPGLSSEQLARLPELVTRTVVRKNIPILDVIRGLAANGFVSTPPEITETLSEHGRRRAQFIFALAQGKQDLTGGDGGIESFSEAKRIAAEAEDAVEGAELLARVAWEQAKSNAAADALATANAVEELALGLALSMEGYQRTMELPRIASAQWKIGDVEDARESLGRAHEAANHILDHGQRSQRLMEIAEVEIEFGQTEDAQRTLDGALAAARLVADSAARTEAADDSLTRMIGLHRKVENFAAALEIVPDISRPNSRIITHINIAADMHRIGDTSTARLEILHVLADIASLSDAWDRVFLSAVVFINGAGELVDAKAVLNQAHGESAFIESDATKLRAEVYLLDARVRSPIPDDGYIATETERLLEALSLSTDVDRWAARRLVYAANAAELYGLATSASSLVDDADWQIRRLAEIAESQVESGDSAGAARTLALAPYSPEEISNILTFTVLAAAQAAAGMKDQAVATLGDARKRVQDGNYNFPRRVLSIVSEAQAEAGDLSGARQTLALALGGEWPYYGKMEDVQRLLGVFVDVAQVKARAAGNKQEAAPALHQAIELASRSGYGYFDNLDALAYNSLWLTATGASVRESLLRLAESQLERHSGDTVSFNHWCSPWAALRSASGEFGDPMAAFRGLEDELSNRGLEWKNRGEIFNCVGDGVIDASLTERGHDALRSASGNPATLRLQGLLRTVPDYSLDDGSIAIIMNWEDGSDDLADAIEHQLEAGFEQQARLLAEHATDYVAKTYFGRITGYDLADTTRLVQLQLRLGMPSDANTLLAQALARFRKDCLTASGEDDCHHNFKHLLTSAAILEGATAR